MRPDGKRRITLPSDVVPTNWARAPPRWSSGDSDSSSLGKAREMRARLVVAAREDADASAFFLLGELDAAAGADELSFSRPEFAAEATCAEALTAGVGALAGFEIASGCVFEVCAC